MCPTAMRAPPHDARPRGGGAEREEHDHEQVGEDDAEHDARDGPVGAELAESATTMGGGLRDEHHAQDERDQLPPGAAGSTERKAIWPRRRNTVAAMASAPPTTPSAVVSLIVRASGRTSIRSPRCRMVSAMSDTATPFTICRLSSTVASRKPITEGPTTTPAAR